MSRRPLSKTGLFISDDDKSSSETSAELWTNSPIAFATGRRGGGEIKIDDTGDLNSNSMSALKVALRASRVRASAAVAKASRLQEEVTRLRDTLKAKSRRADRADELQSDLAKSELRVRELESEKRKVDRALEEMRTVARKREAKAKQSLASLRLTLKGVEDREEERCTRWRSTTRSLRALLESLRRHLQRGLHATPSFTAFQLLEQLFLCLEDKEREARSRQGGASPGAVDAAHGEAKNIPREDGRRRRGSVPQGGEASGSDEEDGGRGKVQGRAEELGSPSSSKRLSTISSLHRENETLRKALDEASASQAASAAAANADVTGREAAIETTRSRFPTEGLYRLAVTKLSTQLQAAREKSRSEKEALRSTGERAAQEELRCQELELELEGMKASVEAAQARTRGLESSLKRAREERDRLERRQQSAVTRALYAALGIAHDTPASFPPMPPPAPAATATETATKATIDLPPGRSRDETLDARAAPIRTPSLHPVLAGELAGGRGRGALGSIATDGTASTSAFPLGETRTSRSPASARARYTNRSQSVGARVSSTGEASRWRQTGDRESALSTKGTASPSGAVDADETIRPTAGDHRGSGVRSATTPGLRDDNDVKLSAVGELGVGGGVDGVPGERAGLKVRVTQEDLARLDEEIANLTKAVEQGRETGLESTAPGTALTRSGIRSSTINRAASYPFQPPNYRPLSRYKQPGVAGSAQPDEADPSKRDGLGGKAR